MKKLLLLFHLICLNILVTAQYNTPPHFSEINGMEDAQNRTHLLYRISSTDGNPLYSSGRNDIYDLVPSVMSDSILFPDYYDCYLYWGYGTSVMSYDFWDNDPQKYIITGAETNCFEPSGFLARYDSVVLSGMFGFYYNLQISKQNDSLIYCGNNLGKSTDGGFTWQFNSDSMSFLSLSPFNDQVFFTHGAYYSGFGSYLYKTTDGGINFSPVDTLGIHSFTFYYDPDGIHIYRLDGWNALKRSDNQGNAFSWQTIYPKYGPLYVALDQQQSGALYIADGKRIFHSSNYGSSFSPYKQFEKNLVGIYKKPGGKLYAADKYNIYELSPGTSTVIKSLPAPAELLSLYPLKTGYKWVYNYFWDNGTYGSSEDIFYRQVLSEQTKPNGKKYFGIVEKFVNLGVSDTVYERIDTTDGKIYRYQQYCPGSEQLVDDLLMDVNDSTFATRFGHCTEHPPTVLTQTENYSKWGLEGKRNKYYYVELITADYHLLTQIGLDYFKLSDDNGDKIFTLKGMLKDSVVYGDTTLLDLIACFGEVPSDYNLEQNYPNPFNPVTVIKWQSPLKGRQTLKVFDLLGKQVAVLVDEERSAGSYEIKFDASTLPSGVYFYQLQAGSKIITKKMVLIR